MNDDNRGTSYEQDGDVVVAYVTLTDRSMHKHDSAPKTVHFLDAHKDEVVRIECVSSDTVVCYEQAK